MYRCNDFKCTFIRIQGSLITVISLRSEKINQEDRRKPASYRRPVLAEKPKSKCGFILRSPFLKVLVEMWDVWQQMDLLLHMLMHNIFLYQGIVVQRGRQFVCLFLALVVQVSESHRQSAHRYEWVVLTWDTT